MTDSERIKKISEDMEATTKRIDRMHTHSHIQLAVTILGFLGIVTISELIKYFKKR